jgi:hypothetical protein
MTIKINDLPRGTSLILSTIKVSLDPRGSCFNVPFDHAIEGLNGKAIMKEAVNVISSLIDQIRSDLEPTVLDIR